MGLMGDMGLMKAMRLIVPLLPMPLIAIADNLQRREFLRKGAALSVAGTALPLALQLAAMGEAVAAEPVSDYKALVCVFMYGGNDYANTVLPYDAASHAAYTTIRTTLAEFGGTLHHDSIRPQPAGDQQPGRHVPT